MLSKRNKEFRSCWRYLDGRGHVWIRQWCVIFLWVRGQGLLVQLHSLYALQLMLWSFFVCVCVCVCVFKVYLFILRETETGWVGRGRERKGRERESQEGSGMPAWSPMRGWNPRSREITTWVETESQSLNRLSHPGGVNPCILFWRINGAKWPRKFPKLQTLYIKNKLLTKFKIIKI